MSKKEPFPPRITPAPEFSGPGALARVLKRGGAPIPGGKNPDRDGAWTVLGVGALWQTAAENAARRSGCDLAQWLTEAINEAAINEAAINEAAADEGVRTGKPDKD
ncbi:MAG: hypothetical protein AB7R90_06820 [Reyranellaceae bacterium]